jgi:hypothetical protein
VLVCRSSRRLRRRVVVLGEEPAGFEEGVDLGAFTPSGDRAFGVADTNKPACLSECATGQVLSSIEPLSVVARRRYVPRTASRLGFGLGVPARRIALARAGTRFWRGALLPREQLPALPRGLAAKALRGNPLCPRSRRVRVRQGGAESFYD